MSEDDTLKIIAHGGDKEDARRRERQ